MWSSVPGGRDALDLLCITFSAYQVLHDSSLLFCAEVSRSGPRLAERVLWWVEDLKCAVKAEDHVSRERCLFVTTVINATMSTLLCHLCCYQNTLLVTGTAFTSVVVKSIDMKSSCDGV